MTDTELKELIEDCCNEIANKIEPLANVKARLYASLKPAINYTRCCTELPTKYSIAFAGFVATNIEVQGSNIKVLNSMNGWGDKIPSKSISIIKK